MDRTEDLTRRVENLELKMKALEIQTRRSADAIRHVTQQLTMVLPKLREIIERDKKSGDNLGFKDEIKVQ